MARGCRDARFVRRERIEVVTQIPSGEGHATDRSIGGIAGSGGVVGSCATLRLFFVRQSCLPYKPLV